MTDLDLTLLTKDYDHLAPLVCGDVEVAGIDLTMERDTENALDRTLNDPSIDIGELSFSRHLIRLANGDRSFVAIPAFVTRGFRRRCFFVRQDSSLNSLEELGDTRIGTNEWPATGNTWSRAVMRETGVDIDSIDWLVGPVDDPDYDMRPHGELPPNVRMTQSDRTLLERLLDGDLDALMCPLPPEGFYEEDSPVVRLIPDYRQAEREFYQRTGLYPAHHVIGFRRDVFERDPQMAERLFEALERSKAVWQARRRRLNDTTPWLQAEIEEITELIGEDWLPYGIEANRQEIETLCEEEYEQGLIDDPLDPDRVFEEYRDIAGLRSD